MGATCYGVKPVSKNSVPAGFDVRPFNRYLWSTYNRDSCLAGSSLEVNRAVALANPSEPAMVSPQASEFRLIKTEDYQ